MLSITLSNSIKRASIPTRTISTAAINHQHQHHHQYQPQRRNLAPSSSKPSFRLAPRQSRTLFATKAPLPDPIPEPEMSQDSKTYSKLPDFSSVVLSRHQSAPTILHIELNEPQSSNALSVAIFSQWTQALRWAAKTDDVHAVVVSGRPRKGVQKGKEVFCAGMSMGGELRESLQKQVESGGNPYVDIETSRHNSRFAKEFIAACIDFPKILVAAVNGGCFGMATTMLPLHDFVYTVPGTIFRTPFAELGVCAEGCSSVTFPPILGPSLTSRMLSFAEPIPAEVLLPTGFLTAILPPSVADASTLPQWCLNDLASKFGIPKLDSNGLVEDSGEKIGLEDYTNLSMTSVLLSKKLRMHQEYRKFLHRVNEEELECVAQLVASPAFPAGIQRFFNKQAAKKRAASKL